MTALAENMDARRETRSPTVCKASARLAFSLDLHNASRGGVRARCSMPLAAGMTINLTLPGRIVRHAKVVWTDGETIGCEFMSPLNDRELAIVLAAAPQVEPVSLLP